jgi:ABC-type multidrug transport system ATPase subunit
MSKVEEEDPIGGSNDNFGSEEIRNTGNSSEEKSESPKNYFMQELMIHAIQLYALGVRQTLLMLRSWRGYAIMLIIVILWLSSIFLFEVSLYSTGKEIKDWKDVTLEPFPSIVLVTPDNLPNPFILPYHLDSSRSASVSLMNGVDLSTRLTSGQSQQQKAFGSEANIDDYMLDNWASSSNELLTSYVIRYVDSSKGALDFSFYYNETLDAYSNSPAFYDAVSSLFLNMSGVGTVSAQIKFFPRHKGWSYSSIVDFYLADYLIFLCYFVFPQTLTLLVWEKENHLRMLMKMKNLRMSMYWLVLVAFNQIPFLVMIGMVIGFGLISQWPMLLGNFPLWWLSLFAVAGPNIISQAFLFTVFFSKTRSASTFGYIYVFLTGLSASILYSIIQVNLSILPPGIWFLYMLLPANTLYLGLITLTNATRSGGAGIWYEVLYEGFGDDNFLWVLFFLFWQTVILLALSIYLESIYSSGDGIKLKPWFMFTPSYWRYKFGYSTRQDYNWSELEADEANEAAKSAIPIPSDVLAAQQNVLADESSSLRVVHVKKDYGMGGGLLGRLRRLLAKKWPVFLTSTDKLLMERGPAVKGITFGIKKGQCLGLLGSNGAGKTSLISVLNGIEKPSGGTAFVEGHDIRSEIASVHQLVGICPQFDYLFDIFSAREHLFFFGRLMGLWGKELTKQVNETLEMINLSKFQHRYAGKFSGGMQRRLSLGIALMGNPVVLLLDEPTTGLDPASRVHIWTMIRELKKTTAILLTTHSMEEATELCDEVAVQKDGRLRCISNVDELISRFRGHSYIHLTVAEADDEKAQEIMKREFPGSVLMDTLGGTQFYLVSTASAPLSTMCEKLSTMSDVEVLDWSISNPSLEEVFLHYTGSGDLMQGEMITSTASVPEASSEGEKTH